MIQYSTMHAFYSDHHAFPLPEGHRFPLGKYALVRQEILSQELLPAHDLRPAPAATEPELLRAHDEDYVRRVLEGGLTAQEIRRIGLPWSPQLVERARRSAGGTIAACRTALPAGIALNLAGGTHHASRNRGQGYCLFNDSIIAIRTMQAEGRIHRALVVDCDVHQGNGTAAIAAGDPTIYTFSIHCESNFPLHKTPGDLDIGLDDGIGDEAYLAALEWGLARALEQARAGLVLYLAGADPWRGDRLGRLALTRDGLARRDRLVLETCWGLGLPVAVMLAGGYGPIKDTAGIHLNTVRIAAGLHERNTLAVEC